MLRSQRHQGPSYTGVYRQGKHDHIVTNGFATRFLVGDLKGQRPAIGDQRLSLTRDEFAHGGSLRRLSNHGIVLG
jgi:hypothetical protein